MSSQNKIPIRDRHFIVGWSLADEKKITQYTKRMVSLYGDPKQEELYNKLANAMLDLIERRDNDHHSAKAELGHDWLTVDPLDSPIVGEDMITNTGLNKLLKIYIGTASGVFKYMGRGTTASTPTPSSTALALETGSRQDTTTTGSHLITGSSYQLSSNYASSLATHTIHQIGTFDATTSGIMLAIHDFGGQGYTHTVNVDAFTLGMICDFLPFGDV